MMNPRAKEVFRKLAISAKLRPLNDLAAWYPLLASTGVPTPKTRLVRAPELISLCDGKTPVGFKQFIEKLEAAALTLGGPPVFLRTGHTSNKHEWRETCFVSDLSKLDNHVAALVEFSAIADPIGFPTDHWAVREFLDLDARFTAFDGMPIAVERRLFVGGGRVVCHHPYWPEEAFESTVRIVEPGWREKLKEMNAVSQLETETILLDMAEETVARVFHGWSVDFVRTKDGEWYAIDMALASESYHWPGCRKARRWRD